MGKRNIVLLGFMGTGKTTAGRILAARLGMTLVDMDEVIAERAGKTISAIFAESGEPYFRALERALVQELSRRTGLVVAAGGGVVLNPDNVADYARSGLVVCLTAEADAILRRVRGESHRPLLEDGDKAARVLQLLESRRAKYEAIPSRVDTTALTPEQVADRIVALYEADPENPARRPG